jgi:nucleoside-diphosphate-sugar epimerase
MKVLVTGATGFIGNYVIAELLKSDCEVIATSSNEQKAKQSEWYGRVKYVPLDFSSFDTAKNYFKFFSEPDLVIHLAWEGLPNYKSAFHEEVNLPRHFAFLSNLISHGLKDLAITGTCFEYGMQEGCLTEAMDCFPANPYARAKDNLRKSVEALQSNYSFAFKWIRLFYMYGKGQNPNSLLSQLDQALERGDKQFNMSGGQQVRDFLPVEKVAEYIVRIALQKNITGIINCASSDPVTVQEFVEAYLKEINKSIALNLGFYPYPDYEPMRFWGDTAKLKTILSND